MRAAWRRTRLLGEPPRRVLPSLEGPIESGVHSTVKEEMAVCASPARRRRCGVERMPFVDVQLRLRPKSRSAKSNSSQFSSHMNEDTPDITLLKNEACLEPNLVRTISSLPRKNSRSLFRFGLGHLRSDDLFGSAGNDWKRPKYQE